MTTAEEAVRAAHQKATAILVGRGNWKPLPLANEDQTHLIVLSSALDAEREKVRALEAKVKDLEEAKPFWTDEAMGLKMKVSKLESSLGRAREVIKEAREKIEARAREHACAGWQCSECAPADVAGGLAL